MANTNVWRLVGPTLNTIYDMPNGFWVKPNNTSNMTVQVDLFTSGGVHDAACGVTLRNTKVPGYTLQSSLALGTVNTGSFITASGHNGVQEFCGGFQITSAPTHLPHHVDISISSYTGSPHLIVSIRRTGAWTALSGDKILLRRSGAWGGLDSAGSSVISQVSQVLIRRTGAWVEL